MGKLTGLQLVQFIEPSTALVQVHPLVPFAPYWPPVGASVSLVTILAVNEEIMGIFILISNHLMLQIIATIHSRYTLNLSGNFRMFSVNGFLSFFFHILILYWALVKYKYYF